jgi:hypothetical protein
VRLGAKDVGRLTFRIHVARAGTYRLAVNYGDIGFPASPRLTVNATSVSANSQPAALDPSLAVLRVRDLGTRSNGSRMMLLAQATLKAGDNVVEILGGAYALDIDYLEVTAGG